MSQITQEGTYQVTLEDCHFEASQKGNGAFCKLTGRTEAGETITAHLNCTTDLIQKGPNAGSPWWKVTMKTLKELGLTDPAAIETLNGKIAQFKVDWSEYKGQRRLEVKFVNGARPAMKKEEVAALFQAMQSGGPGVAAAAAAPDDPFAEGGASDPNDLPI